MRRASAPCPSVALGAASRNRSARSTDLCRAPASTRACPLCTAVCEKLGIPVEQAKGDEVGYSGIATAVVIYPLVKRWSETVSLGYVAARIMESVFIAIGLMSIISVLDVNDALAGARGVEATALAVQGNSW
jgi:hypothetical protein